MIRRYEHPEIRYIWEDLSRIKHWLLIENCMINARAGKRRSKRVDQILGLMNCWQENTQVLLTATNLAEVETRHDVSAFLAVVADRLEKQGEGMSSYLHVGMTSSDTVDTANAMMAAKSLAIINKSIAQFQKTRSDILFAVGMKKVPTCGYTHGKVAEKIDFWDRLRRVLIKPIYISFPVHLSGVMGNGKHIKADVAQKCWRYLYAALNRDARLYFSTCDINFHRACDESKILKAIPLMQTADRVPYAKLMFEMALRATQLEKLAIDLRLLVALNEATRVPPKKEVGSTAMPHKINPWELEQVSGMCRLLRSYVTPAMENCTLWLERDISHSSVERVIWPDAFHAFMRVLSIMESAIKQYAPNLPAIAIALKENQEILGSHEALVKCQRQGVPMVEAYRGLQKRLRPVKEPARCAVE